MNFTGNFYSIGLLPPSIMKGNYVHK